GSAVGPAFSPPPIPAAPLPSAARRIRSCGLSIGRSLTTHISLRISPVLDIVTKLKKRSTRRKTPGRSSPDKLDCKGQTRFRFVPRVSVIAVAAGGIEPASLGNRFEQRRFPLPSLTGEKGHEVFKL